MHNVTFTTCSYIKDIASPRASMTRKAISTWGDLLDMPFAEKIFLDDHSPDFGALKVLANSSMLDKFTRVHYSTVKHPPHCNFGTVGCLQLANTPFILHLDDDILVTMSADKCRQFIEEGVKLLENDPTIMGSLMLTFDPKIHGSEWAGGESYPLFPSWSYPQKYFGSSASLIRRELLQRVTYDQLLSWGANQPANWEMLISNSVKEFVVPPSPTPFAMPDAAFFYSSTAEPTTKERINFRYRRLIRDTKRALRENLPAPILALSRSIRGIKHEPESKP